MRYKKFMALLSLGLLELLIFFFCHDKIIRSYKLVINLESGLTHAIRNGIPFGTREKNSTLLNMYTIAGNVGP